MEGVGKSLRRPAVHENSDGNMSRMANMVLNLSCMTGARRLFTLLQNFSSETETKLPSPNMAAVPELA